MIQDVFVRVRDGISEEWCFAGQCLFEGISTEASDAHLIEAHLKGNNS